MRSHSDIVSTRPNRRVHGLPSGALAVIALVGGGLLYLSFTTTADPARPFDPRCETWDDAANAAIARLIATRDETAEAFFGDAVFRLRRARRNCRSGWVGLARGDYEALSDGRIGNRYWLRHGRRLEASPQPRLDRNKE